MNLQDAIDDLHTLTTKVSNGDFDGAPINELEELRDTFRELIAVIDKNFDEMIQADETRQD